MTYTTDQIGEDTRRQIRRAISGQEDEPVQLTTDGTHEPAPAPAPPTTATASEIVQELQAENPLLLEALASRALIRKLQQELAATRDGKGETEG